MKTSDFSYHLPEEYIAQTPIEPRDHSRLLVYHREDGRIEHRHFYDIPDYLRGGDALVLNDTRVIPARLLGVRENTGGAVEILLLRRIDIDTWETLVKPGKKLRPGARAVFGNGALVAEILDTTAEGGRIVRFHYEGVFEEILDALGNMPLPPYIKARLEDKERYQTVYAREAGSAAAPTAGLHFTPALLKKAEDMGVDIIRVLLHVGLGTFRPVKVDDVKTHVMHSEHWEIAEESAAAVNRVHEKGGRVFCVGTTSVRTLETAAREDGAVSAGKGDTDIFIYPGYRFKCVDALITNFHLPESTLLMLVAALIGREETLRIYDVAVKEKYRFFSFGDAMLIL